MENFQLLKSKLLLEADNLNLGIQSKMLLAAFADNPLWVEKPQEAFIEASQTANLIGPNSLILASRIKCEHVIKNVLSAMQITSEIDSIVPKLMVDIKEKK